MAKVTGLKLKLEIAESNLAVKATQLEELKRTHADVVTERDFLRKVVLNLSDHRC